MGQMVADVRSEHSLAPPPNKNIIMNTNFHDGMLKHFLLSLLWELQLHELQTKTHSVALVRQRTISTERPPFVGEVNANFCG
jgi:hypothetical protein